MKDEVKKEEKGSARVKKEAKEEVEPETATGGKRVTKVVQKKATVWVEEREDGEE